MKINKDQLLANDWSTLFTQDPNTFFEAILINILWDKKPGSIDPQVVEKQRYIFERWFKYYALALRQDIEKEVGALEAQASADFQNGYISGQIAALSNLPMLNGAFGKRVDLIAVTKELKKLKAIEPRGVTTDESQTIPTSNS
jgi:hypothetical protein